MPRVILFWPLQFGQGTNMFAKAKSLLLGLQLCSEKGIVVQDIECDSKVLVDCIIGKSHHG